MEDPFILLFTLICAVSMAAVVVRPVLVYEYPGAMSAVFTMFILPQILALSTQTAWIPLDAFENVCVMAFLCIVACWVGYLLPPIKTLADPLRISLDEDRLFSCGVILIALGTFFMQLVRALGGNEEYKSSFGTATGAITIYYFFGSLVYPGLGIAVTCALRKPSIIRYVVVAGALFTPVTDALFSGRRESTVLMVTIIGLTLFFQKGWRPSRVLTITGILAAGIGIPLTSHYRSLVVHQGLSGLSGFDPINALEEEYAKKSAPELTVATLTIDNTLKTGEFGYGGGYWNHIIFRFVPAQIIGADLKKALNIPVAPPRATPSPVLADKVGSTMTGLGDSFHEFWYLGCGVFALFAVMFKTLWQVSVTEHRIAAQLLYMTSLTSAMRGLTHQTCDHVTNMIYNGIFLGLVFFYSYQPPTRKR